MTDLQDNNKFELAVVMPIYNEEECIKNVIDLWDTYLNNLNINYLIIAINDGSTDNTISILKKYSDSPHIHVICKNNSGHGPTILMGYSTACLVSDWVFQVDSDNEMGPEHFIDLWSKRDQYDALLGVRTNRKQNLLRKIITTGSRIVTKSLFGNGVKDVNTPYRLIRSQVLSKIVNLIPPDTFAPNVLISGMLSMGHYTVCNMPVPHKYRITGTESLVKWNLWKAALKAIYQTISFRMEHDARYNHTNESKLK